MMMKAQKTWSTPVRSENRSPVPCAVCGQTEFKPYLICDGYAYVRCAVCGLVQVNPQPEKNAVFERYAGETYLNYELSNEKSFFRLGKLALFDANISQIEEFAQMSGNRRVLEIGCATGALLEFLLWRGWEAQGVEISARQAGYAREKRSLTISTLPLEENHFPDGHFSLIIASHLIEHLNDPASFVREVRRLLISGGRFIVTTPNIASLQAKIFGNKWRSAIFDHLYLFSKATLTRLLEQEGFTVEKTVTWGGIAQGSAPRPIKSIVDRAAKLFGFGDVVMIRAAKPA
jgi:SAM-dependent methyltransferase